MTKDEEILKLTSRVAALEAVVSILCSALGRTFPTFSTSLQKTGMEMREQYSKIVLKGYPPEQSDLIAGEYQDALDNLMKFIETRKK